MTQATAPKKTSYAGLIVPFGLVGLALIAWTVWWFVVAGRIEGETDRQAQALRQAGYTVSWAHRGVNGWPFRSFVKFEDFRVVSPSGYAVSAPELGAEAQTYALGKWVIAAPKGLTVVRGAKGAVQVTGDAIRASLSGLGGPAPRLAAELRNPTFTPAAGAEPFPLADAKTVDLYVEPKPGAADDGEARFLFRIVEARARPGAVLDWIAGGGKFSTQWEGLITRADALHGHTWAQAIKGWTARGGALTDIKAQATAGDAGAMATSPRLTVSPDGRVLGLVELDLTKGPAALFALGRSGKVDPAAAAAAAATTAISGGLNQGTAHVELVFGEDGSHLGPVRLAPAPRVF